MQRAAGGFGGELVELRLLFGGEGGGRTGRGEELQLGKRRLFGRGEQLQRLRELHVADAVDGGQKLEQVEAGRADGKGHGKAPSEMAVGLGSRTRISAAMGGVEMLAAWTLGQMRIWPLGSGRVSVTDCASHWW